MRLLILLFRLTLLAGTSTGGSRTGRLLGVMHVAKHSPPIVKVKQTNESKETPQSNLRECIPHGSDGSHAGRQIGQHPGFKVKIYQKGGMWSKGRMNHVFGSTTTTTTTKTKLL
jgi:hypothetical protein